MPSNEANQYNKLNIKDIQTDHILWLDNQIDKNNQDCQTVITQLQRVILDVYTYTDNDECVDFILESTNTKVYLIISKSIGQYIVPLIHDIPNIDAIFIFDNNDEHNRDLHKCSKLKGVFNNIKYICQRLKRIIYPHDHDAIPISFLSSEKRLNQLDPEFMHTQILKEILLDIEYTNEHVKEFVDYYHNIFTNNEIDRNKVKRLTQEYRKKSPIWWYTRELFMYDTLNRALRVMDYEAIILMGFFIRGLHEQIKKLHEEQLGTIFAGDSFEVYRGQSLTKTNFNKLKESQGGLMSFNSLLSTSRKQTVSLMYLPTNTNNSNLVSVLFVIKIDPKQLTTAVASVQHLSQFPEEEEFLFSMHSIFRIGEITRMEGGEEVYKIELTLTSDNDKQLSVLTEQIREESSPGKEPWRRLTVVLCKMEQLDIAERICNKLLARATNIADTVDVYNQLGSIKCRQGKYEEARKCFNKVLARSSLVPSFNDSHSASCINNIGNIYSEMGSYRQALIAYERALKTELDSRAPEDLNIALYCSNIGDMYSHLFDYPAALESYKWARDIERSILPFNHPQIVSTYNNIGVLYFEMNNYLRAASFFKEVLELRENSLPYNDPKIARSYINLGNAYFHLKKYDEALSLHEKGRKILQSSLAADHPDIAQIYNCMGVVCSALGYHSKARSYYERAVEIGQRMLSPDHPSIQSYLKNLHHAKMEL